MPASSSSSSSASAAPSVDREAPRRKDLKHRRRRAILAAFRSRPRAAPHRWSQVEENLFLRQPRRFTPVSDVRMDVSTNGSVDLPNLGNFSASPASFPNPAKTVDASLGSAPFLGPTSPSFSLSALSGSLPTDQEVASLKSGETAAGNPSHASLPAPWSILAYGPFAPPTTNIKFDHKYKYKREQWKDLTRVESFAASMVLVRLLLTIRDRARQARIPPEVLLTILSDFIPESTLNWALQSIPAESSNGYLALELVGNYALTQTHLVILLEASQHPIYQQPPDLSLKDYFNIVFKFMTVEQTHFGIPRKFFFTRMATGLSSVPAVVKHALLMKIDEVGEDPRHKAKIPAAHFDAIWSEVCRETGFVDPDDRTGPNGFATVHSHPSKNKSTIITPKPSTFTTSPANISHNGNHSSISKVHAPSGNAGRAIRPAVPPSECPLCAAANVHGQMHWKAECPRAAQAQKLTRMPPTSTSNSTGVPNKQNKPSFATTASVPSSSDASSTF